MLEEVLRRLQQPPFSEFEQVLRLNPSSVKAHANLGVALLKLGRLEEAARQFDETLRLDPQNPQALAFKRNLLRSPTPTARP